MQNPGDEHLLGMSKININIYLVRPRDNSCWEGLSDPCSRA
jgi:hypothetical protein